MSYVEIMTVAVVVVIIMMMVIIIIVVVDVITNIEHTDACRNRISPSFQNVFETFFLEVYSRILECF